MKALADGQTSLSWLLWLDGDIDEHVMLFDDLMGHLEKGCKHGWDSSPAAVVYTPTCGGILRLRQDMVVK